MPAPSGSREAPDVDTVAASGTPPALYRRTGRSNALCPLGLQDRIYRYCEYSTGSLWVLYLRLLSGYWRTRMCANRCCRASSRRVPDVPLHQWAVSVQLRRHRRPRRRPTRVTQARRRLRQRHLHRRGRRRSQMVPAAACLRGTCDMSVLWFAAPNRRGPSV